MDADFAAGLDATGDRVPASERQAALALHSMLPADRSWMLARVPAASRERLQGLLDELQGLGVPAQPQWMRERCLGDVSGEAPPRPTPAPAVDARQLVGSLSSAQAHQLLAAEPDRLIAEVLQQGPFRWQAPLLGLLSARRSGIESLLHRPVAASAVRRQEALLDGLAARAARLKAEAGPQAAPVAGRGADWSRWARRLWGRKGSA